MKKNKESKENKENEDDKASIILLIIESLLALLLLFGIMLLRTENDKLQKRLEFEPIKEGLCVYVEYDHWQGCYTYCLVYDYETERVIEVDLYDELIHTTICAGDTIIYCVDYDYCDADFLNVIKE